MNPFNRGFFDNQAHFPRGVGEEMECLDSLYERLELPAMLFQVIVSWN